MLPVRQSQRQLQELECEGCVCIVAGFCKQQLWPLFHYLLPLSPNSTGRFNPELWQAYVKANKVRLPVFSWRFDNTHVPAQALACRVLLTGW